jgi:DNA-binding HxlR family transcriptional regulator
MPGSPFDEFCHKRLSELAARTADSDSHACRFLLDDAGLTAGRRSVTFCNRDTIEYRAATAQGGTFLKPRHSDDHAECRALGEVLSRIGDKWTVFVVGLLSHGPRRFNEIRREIGGISQRMLTLTLRGLERDGLVKRTVFPTIPPRVDYELTPLGKTLIEPLTAIGAWAVGNRPAVEKARTQFDAEREETNPEAPRARTQRATAAAPRP